MTNKLIYMLLLFCSVGVIAQDKLRIKGKIEGIPNEATLSLSFDKLEIEFNAVDGIFEVETQIIKAPTSVYLFIKNGEDFKYTSFFLGNESVTIEGNVNNLKYLQAKGSAYDGLRYESVLLTKDVRTARDVIESKISKLVEEGMSQDSAMASYKEEYLGIEQNIKDLDYEFLKKNINTDYGRYILGFIINDDNIDHYKELYNLVDNQYLNTDAVVFLKTLLDREPLMKGDKYYDFIALDLNPKESKFSDNFKGQYVLLDFSSPYCWFCRQAVPITTKITEALEDKLVHVTYCIDNDLVSAKQYKDLKGDKGVIVWDKKGMMSSTIAKYRMRGTPYYVLFNPQGRVLKIFDQGLEENFEEQLRALMK
ncbi:redoxin family protein [Myroides sp. N17-2]|uniref:TlpA family protein disulfide reductase n=1 Tax=Myroides sp. N17-2 TaxID=2030799 RepID=UPI000EFCD3E0|nr:redoxin family protein [Myroides sp. N17-2]